MNNRFLETIREYLWNVEILLLIFRQNRKRGHFEFFKKPNFLNDTPEIK